MRVYMLDNVPIPATYPVLLGALERRHKPLTHLNTRPEKAKWLAGEQFSAAEIMTIVIVTTLRQFAPTEFSEYPSVLRWMRDCIERPGYRRAMARADPGIDVEGQLSAEGPALFGGIAEARELAKVETAAQRWVGDRVVAVLGLDDGWLSVSCG